MIDFKHSHITSATYSYDCEGSGCDDEGICRCGQITGVELIDLPELYKKYSRHFQPQNEIESYCLFRLCKEYNIWDVLNYEWDASSDYYGEELDSAYFSDEHELARDFYAIQTMTDDDKIRFLLEKEYGHILPKLKEATFKRITIKRDDLKLSSGRRQAAVSELYKSVLETGIPQGIVEMVGDKYHTIDGNHRISVFPLMVGNDPQDIVRARMAIPVYEAVI